MKAGVYVSGPVVAAALCLASATASTPKPARVAEVAMGTVLFAADSDKITTEGTRILDGIAARITDPQTQKIIVRGHSEPTEHAEFGPEYGVGLAHRRASNVQSYFIERGLKPQNVNLATFGDTRPIKGAPPAKLRRVEIFFGETSGW